MSKFRRKKYAKDVGFENIFAPEKSVKSDKVSARPKSHRKKRTWPLVFLAVVMFGISAAVCVNIWLTNRSNQAQVKKLIEQANSGSNPAPSTVKPNVTTYQVAPNMPRYLIIPKINVKARVMPLGVSSQNQLQSPGNVYDVGWYNASSLPGQPGAMLIDGHLDGFNVAGVFWNLNKLLPGDSVELQRGDGTVYTYKVIKSINYNIKNVDMAAALQPVIAGQPGLNMITCSGQLMPGTYSYNERLIVFTEQVSVDKSSTAGV